MIRNLINTWVSPQNSTFTEKKRHIYLIIIFAVLLFSPYNLLLNSTYQGSSDPHSIIETTGGLLAIIAGLAFILRFYTLGNRLYLFIGLAFFVNGAEDVVHGLLSFHGLFGVPASTLTHFIPGTYVTGRLMFGLLLILGPLVSSQYGDTDNPKFETKWTSILVLATTALFTMCAFYLPLPRFIFPEMLISRPIDLVSAIIMLAALLAFLKEYHRKKNILVWWISCSITVCMVGQILMSFSKALYDPFFDIAHVYKILGYAIPLLGLSLYQVALITEQKLSEDRLQKLSLLKEALLKPESLSHKSKLITDAVVDIFDADFARIWITSPGDRCDSGCIHAGVKEGPHVCHLKERCLHLVASSGRYTHLDGEIHRRVPFGCYKIGRVAAGEKTKVITNNVTADPRVHNNDWARELGLVSFAGYRLHSDTGQPMGVLALFSKHAIDENTSVLLEDLAHTTAHVIKATKVEDALRESEENARAILNASPDAALLLDVEGKILDVNREMEKRHNKSRNELLDSSALEISTPELGRSRGKKIQEVLSTKKPARFEDEQFGRILYNIIHPLVSSNGRIKRLVVFSRDITEWRETEKKQFTLYMQLKKSQEQLIISEKLRVTGVLAAGVAHELSNPMMGILNFTQYCLKHTSKDDRLHKVLEDIERETKHCVHIVQNLLTFSRKKDTEAAYEYENCRGILDRVLNLLSYRIEREGASVVISIDENIPRIPIRTGEIQEVCLNLLSNALDAVKNSERKEIQINASRETGFVKLVFTDTGCGIDSKIKDHIFDPFFTTKAVGEGTGLGLSILRNIVLDHGGDVRCSSDPGALTKFEVLLPTERKKKNGKPYSCN